MRSVAPGGFVFVANVVAGSCSPCVLCGGPPAWVHVASSSSVCARHLDPYGHNGADGIHMGERLRDRGLLEGEGAFTRAVRNPGNTSAVNANGEIR